MDISNESEPKCLSSQEPAIQKLFGSSSIFKTPEFKRDRHMHGNLIIKDKANTHYQAGMEAVDQLDFERAVTSFTKAITLQPEQTQLYVARAEAYLQLCDFKSAALDYKYVCYLEPQKKAYFHRLAFIYYLQGQCYCDQGMFFEALESFAKAVELKPGFRPYHMRSLACLTVLGRYGDAIRLVTNWLESDTPSADLFTLRARLHHQLNQPMLCYYDLKAALRLNPSCPEARALLEMMEQGAECSHQQAVNKAVEGALSDALGKITTALELNPENAQYYIFRGILYRRLKDFTASIEDLMLAVEFRDDGAKHPEGEKPEESKDLEQDAHIQLVLTYNDFAVHCFTQGFYSEATMLLTKAIHEQRDESRLFINRGDCFFRQKEWLFALADYQQAEELDPQNATIWLRLAVIHNTLGLHSYENLNFQEAVDKFSVAIKYNPGVALYYGNRAKAHSRMQRMEEATQDAVCALILDPANDELVPLLLRLFPGCSLSDVISSDTAQTVKAQLMERIQTWKLAGFPVSRLSNKLERMVLTQDTDSQLETDSENASSREDVDVRFKAVANTQDPVRTKEQVSEAVKKLLHQRQSLSYTGPRIAPLCITHNLEPAASTSKRPYSWRNFGGMGLNC
ncbi:tetratricopeptide repeat protein 16 [Ictalurus punctatus]|uniref:Tetratricopeptide repeat protein 16 n=1 Tax=Ictalurus punctatus TaxID=7998 RepID=A0A2D0PRA8_ICTPU|nr:tetratricopeptide repeat protein 16 [Ictalurus punctatus]XP_017307972.1 tetratricopeptide repeat protein 16 [Ictalurus punctatus]